MVSQAGKETDWKMKYLIGNWKSNYTLSEARDWIDEVKRSWPGKTLGLKVVVCPAYIHLPMFKREFAEVDLGSQDISPFPDGAYTGEVSGRMIKSLVDYVILGHSERRKYFGVTDQMVARQVEQALAENITPVVAVDKAGWGKQLSQFDARQLSKTIVMYEPPEAISKPIGPIGEGEAASLDEVYERVSIIRGEFKIKAVIYGGSVKADNIADYLKIEGVDGVLPGSASLNAKEWIKMVEAAVGVIG
jgi:triosephosphate isomerase